MGQDRGQYLLLSSPASYEAITTCSGRPATPPQSTIIQGGRLTAPGARDCPPRPNQITTSEAQP